MNRWLRNLLLALLLSGAAGCATTNGGDPRDPLEGFNRAMYSFNDGFDQAIGRPVATLYRDALTEPIRIWIRNVFANIADLWIGANSLLQGKPKDAVVDWARFAFNSTFGVFGLNDIASDMGLEKHDEDFGQTFGRWGAGDGAYVVWPFLGSSNVRDTVGLVFDIGLDPVLLHEPVRVRNVMTVLRATSRPTRHLPRPPPPCRSRPRLRLTLRCNCSSNLPRLLLRPAEARLVPIFARFATIAATAVLVLTGGAQAQEMAPDVLVKNVTLEVVDILQKDKDIQKGDR